MEGGGEVGAQRSLWVVDHVTLLYPNVGYMVVSVCENLPSCILMICALLCVFIMLR